MNRLRVRVGQRVCRLGAGPDIDEVVDRAIAVATGSPPIDRDCVGADVAVVWFRRGDGDLDTVLARLADTVTELELVWLFTPAVGCPGHLGDGQVLAAARRAEMFAEPGVMARPRWTGTRLHPA
ncbi:DUF3052 family protein [Nocardia thailandica]